MSIHPEFAKRLKLAGIAEESSYYSRRWEGVVEFASQLRSVPGVLDVVRMLVKGATAAIPPALETALRNADAGFTPGGNQFEMSLLAGFVLRHLWDVAGDTGDNIADVGALSVITWDYDGRARQTPIDPFVGDALTYQRARSAALTAVRRRPPDPRPPTILSHLVDTIRIAGAANSTQSLVDPLSQLVSNLETELAQQREVEAYCKDAIGALDEASDAAWWVIGEYSRDFDVPMRDLPPSGAPVILGKELSDIAGRLPGNFSAAPLLARTLEIASGGRKTARKKKGGTASAAETLTIFEVVNALPRQWREAIAASCARISVGEFTPVFSAISTSLDAPDNEWASLFLHRIGVDPQDTALARRRSVIARHAYLEGLLVRELNSRALSA